MKKIILGFAVLGAVLAGCKKEESKTDNGSDAGQTIDVKKTQSSFFIDLTATWCGPCGSSGTPLFKSVASKTPTTCVSVALHTSNSELTPYFMRNDTAYITPILNQIFGSLGIATNANGGYGIPAFSLNNAEITRNENTILNAINNRAANQPIANIGFKITPNSNGFEVSTTTKFFEDAMGEYNVAIFVLEDNIIHRQMVNTAYVNNYEHMSIVRDVVGGTAEARRTFGTEPIVNSNLIKEGTTINKSFTYTKGNHSFSTNLALNRYNWNPQRTKVAVTLWRKDGNRYTFINGSTSDYLQK